MQKFMLLVLLALLLTSTEVVSLKCHKCPPSVHTSARECLAGPLQHCKSHDTACFFEYEKRTIRFGCGRDWAKPAGCYGLSCIEWCKEDKCNAALLRYNAPFDLDLDDEPATGSPSIMSWRSAVFSDAAKPDGCCMTLTMAIAAIFLFADTL
ncbi:uncharacterized protein LOC116601890 [Nematostella vectensis]|uniref:uncharacterized protein LOC116601890 n=1 Tax=Nematostella vectensis TaxID=45351 RepID=UPI0020779BD6|nr:uncharacterized protein LOC116601890 [Nematostella vectensis]